LGVGYGDFLGVFGTQVGGGVALEGGVGIAGVGFDGGDWRGAAVGVFEDTWEGEEDELVTVYDTEEVPGMVVYASPSVAAVIVKS